MIGWHSALGLDCFSGKGGVSLCEQLKNKEKTLQFQITFNTQWDFALKTQQQLPQCIMEMHPKKLIF